MLYFPGVALQRHDPYIDRRLLVHLAEDTDTGRKIRLRTADPLTKALVAALAAACSPAAGRRADQIPVGAARTYRLAGFSPQTFVPSKPQRLSFTIEQPSGAPLTSYRTGSGPHTGVHLIIVRSDLGAIIHRHPPIGAGRTDRRGGDASRRPGRYRVVVDAYPQARAGRSGTSSSSARSRSPARRRRNRCRRSGRRSTVDGYRFALHDAARTARDQAGVPATSPSRGPNGSPATFTPWFGALAHAIFFRAGSLDYFHTHVCAAGHDRLHERARPDARDRKRDHGRGSCASASCFPCRAHGGCSCRARWTAAS